MPRQIEFFRINAFTNNPFGGNPAAVICSEQLVRKQMQAIAKEFNLSETAFLFSSPKADYRLRWFTPLKEIDLCGHATIASLHFLYSKKKFFDEQEISFETRYGILKCGKQGKNYYLRLSAPNLSEITYGKSEIIKALNISSRNIFQKTPFVLLENGYLFICIDTLQTLLNLKPDLNRLLEISFKYPQIKDFAVFTTETIQKQNSAHLRFFAPFHGINEDPVTGSALGPLPLVMKKMKLILNTNKVFTFEQGDVIGRKGRARVKIDSLTNEIILLGEAFTVMKGNLYL